MKTYDYKKDQRQAADNDQEPAEKEFQAMNRETPFAEVAYEWNNALRIAVEKMWRD